MKTILIYFLALLVFTKAVEDSRNNRRKRGYFHSTYPLAEDLQIGGVNVNSYGRGKVLSLPSQGVSQNNPHFFDLPPLIYPGSNAIDKPVTEVQDDVPQESYRTAILPPMPPPATPVNAAAANVPGVGNAAFIGAGGLGVVDLGGGAYALGSGSISYSERRLNPRQSLKQPFLPDIRASPDLLPAAVRSDDPPPPIQSSYQGYHPPLDQNGYEFLTPERVAFGSPRPPRPLRVVQNFAVPSPLEIQPQFPQLEYGQPQQRLAPQTFGTQQQQQQQQQQQFIQQQQFQQQQQQQQFQQQQQQQEQSPQEAIFGQRLSNVFESTHLMR